MRLAFNATALLSPLTGIGQYSHYLAQGLLARDDLAVDFFYGAFWDEKLHASPSNNIAAALPWLRRHLPYSYELRRWLQNNRFSRQARRVKFDVYHEPNILPLRFSGPTVITVHDLSWIRHPETHPVERVRAMNRYFEDGLRQASAIITDSSFVKQELMDVFGVNPQLISAIPLGVDSQFSPQTAAQTAAVLASHQLSHGRYFLAVGTLEPRKNLSLALNAYQQLPQSIRKQYPLVLVGMAGWGTSELELRIAPLVRAGEVRRLGYVDRSDLVTLMAGALTLVYPSIYEGFGLPPLESMACGVPVICANTSSLPEVVGDAGVLVHPRDESEMACALVRMVEDSAWRLELSRAALHRAGRFTWPACVDMTTAVYRAISLDAN